MNGRVFVIFRSSYSDALLYCNRISTDNGHSVCDYNAVPGNRYRKEWR